MGSYGVDSPGQRAPSRYIYRWIEGRRSVRSVERHASVSATLGVVAAMNTKVVERFPAGAPRGSWPAEEYAARLRAEGEPGATVVMDLSSDAFLVVVRERSKN